MKLVAELVRLLLCLLNFFTFFFFVFQYLQYLVFPSKNSNEAPLPKKDMPFVLHSVCIFQDNQFRIFLIWRLGCVLVCFVICVHTKNKKIRRREMNGRRNREFLLTFKKKIVFNSCVHSYNMYAFPTDMLPLCLSSKECVYFLSFLSPVALFF